MKHRIYVRPFLTGLSKLDHMDRARTALNASQYLMYGYASSLCVAIDRVSPSSRLTQLIINELTQRVEGAIPGDLWAPINKAACEVSGVAIKDDSRPVDWGTSEFWEARCGICAALLRAYAWHHDREASK